MKLTHLTACLVVSLAVVGNAHAQEVTESTSVAAAEKYAAQAYDAYAKKEYAEAVALYLKAYDASPSADIVYNVAKIYDTKLKDRELAMTFYRRYITDPGAEPERIKGVNERLSQLKDAEAAANESKPEADGQKETSASVAGQPAAESPGWSTTQYIGLAATVVGAAGIGVGAGFGVAAMSDADRANENCDGNACASQEGVDATKAAKREATISTLGIGLGSAFVVGGVLLMLLTPSDAVAADSTAVLVPTLGMDTAGFSVVGSW